jgi:hypothetical protein
LTWNGRIPRRNREYFCKYLNHKDERIRAYACQIETADAWALKGNALYRLDKFAEALIAIAGEDAEFLKLAPHSWPISRPDDFKAAKEPILRWQKANGTA